MSESETKDLIINAFNNKVTGLSRNIAKLKQKNPLLKDIPTATIRQVLDQNIPVYNRNMAPIHEKESVKYRSSYVGQMIHADLMFIQSPRNTAQTVVITEGDRVNKYVLVLIDTYSRYLWAYTLEDKSADVVTVLIEETVNQIRKLFYEGYDDLVFTIYSDKGTEFSTKQIEKIKNVKHRQALQHAVLAESAIFQIRTKLKYLPEDNWDDDTKLNNAIGKKPKLARNETELTKFVFDDLIKNINIDSGATDILNRVDDKNTHKPETINLKVPEQAFKQGDFVRVLRPRKIFEKKSSTSLMSNLVFVVLKAHYYPKDGVFMYTIGTLDGEYVSNKRYYASDLAIVSHTLVSQIDRMQMVTPEDKKDYFLKQ